MLTSRFAHVHFPRTGGSTLEAFLGDIPGAEAIDSTPHMPYGDMCLLCISRGHAIPPAFVFIRHPCAWYVSHWCWATHTDDYRIGGASFAEFMETIRLGSVIFRPYTSMWWRQGGDHCQYIGRFENYQVEVVRILRAIIPDLLTESAIRARIQAAGYARRVARPDGQFAGDWRQYYNSDWLAQVVKWDGGLMKRFGYKI